jgi:MscS family membrane protein
MSRNVTSAVTFSVLLVVLLGLAGPRTQAEEKPKESLRSPRATVRTLFTSITLARSDPQLIERAAACLDLSGLPANQQTFGGLLATQLEAVLRARATDTKFIPDKAKGDVYVFPDWHGLRIGLKRMPDGRWLFDRETVALIPKLYAEAQKQLQEKNKQAASQNVSPDYVSPRAAFRTLLNAYRREDYGRILRSMDLSDIPTVAREEVGTLLANKLKQIAVRHRLPVLQEIPDSNYSETFVWLSQPEGVIEVVRQPSGKRKGEWLISRDTINSIDKLYLAFEDKPYNPEVVAAGLNRYRPSLSMEPELWLRNQMPDWLLANVLSAQNFTLQVYEVLGYVLVAVLAFGLHRLVTWLLTACLEWFVARRGWPLPRETILNRVRPTGRFAGVLFLRWGLLMLGPDRVVLVPLLVVLNPLLWVLGMWAIFRLLDLIGELMETHLAAQKRRAEITQMLWPVGSLVVKVTLFVAVMFHLMTLFSWDMTAVLTGLGIGGLAFALGAQDALKNLFGSFTLIADRPFVVGELVKIGGQDMGVVEVVGLRSTRIRTADDTLLIVPNSNLTTMNITNYGRRRYRNYLTRIGVAYATLPERLTAFRDGIQELIRQHKHTRKDQFEVAINDMTASAIEILVNVYFEVADRRQELEAREGLILDILRLADDLNVELAYPTQTIHVVPPAEPAGRSVERVELVPSAHA